MLHNRTICAPRADRTLWRPDSMLQKNTLTNLGLERSVPPALAEFLPPVVHILLDQLVYRLADPF